MGKRMKGLAGNLLLLGAASLVSLGALEVCLALVRPLGSVIGRLPPGVHTFVNHEFTERMTVNRFGFREGGFSPTRSSQNVLLLGDSFLEGTGESDDEAPASLLNSRFPSKEYQFFNAGISGTNIADYGDTYRHVMETVKVPFSQVVVFLFLGNDLLDYQRVKVLKRNEEARGVGEERAGRWVVRVAEKVLPNTVALARQVRSTFQGPPEGIPSPGDYGAHTHIDWFNRNDDYFGRGPLTREEVDRLEVRFQRVPEEIRDLMARGLVNRWCYNNYLIEPLQDFVFNMDSEQNERVFRSSMGQLGALIDMIDLPVSVVIIPDKIQVSETERQVAEHIIGPGLQEDEFSDMLEVNHRMADWLHEHYPSVGIYDVTPDLLEGGAAAFYYQIDGHMRPAGSRLLADAVMRLVDR